MGKTRKMRLVAFLKTGPTAHHHGMWRHPETDNDFLDPAWYEHDARVLEKGRFDCLFFADTLGLFDNYRGNFDAILRGGGQMGFLDPLPVLAVMSRVTRHIGLGATLSTTFHNPYQIARTLGTLDVLSKGRMAWNVVSSISNLEARQFRPGRTAAARARSLRPRRRGHGGVLQALGKLGARRADRRQGKRHIRRSFQGALRRLRRQMDKDTRPAHHSAQPARCHPVIMQAGASDRGRDFAARWSEMIFTLQHSKADMQTFYTDIKQRVAKFGRPLEDCAVLPSVDPIIGETESIAREKQAYINELVDPEVALALVSTHIGVDLSKYPIDQPLQNIEIEQGARGSFEVILQGTKAHGLTLGEAARRFATSELAPQIVGTPKSVADQLQDYFRSRACDGFILTPTVFPAPGVHLRAASCRSCRSVELFRSDYTGRTLREHLHD